MRVIIDTQEQTSTLIGATIEEYFDYFTENDMENYTVVEESHADSIFSYTSTT